MSIVRLPTKYYQQFDADFSLDTPAESFGGWRTTELELNTETSAIVVFHAAYSGEYKDYPGWHRHVEYIPRAYEIAKEVFPGILGCARDNGIRVYHVPFESSSKDYYGHLPGYEKVLGTDAVSVAEVVEPDEIYNKLREFKTNNVSPGFHNRIDIERGLAEAVEFLPEAKPIEGESIVTDADKLAEICKEDGVNHLIYIGFAINWCLLMSPCGMVDMSRYGFICSTISEAVTAVECKETARAELCKELALWRVSLAFGFVYEAQSFIKAIGGNRDI